MNKLNTINIFTLGFLFGLIATTIFFLAVIEKFVK
jgi:hypothetical protein